VFEEAYILFHFNIILKNNGISSTKIKKCQRLQNAATITHSVRPSDTQFDANTAEKATRILRRIGRKPRIYVEKISLDLEEQKEAESDIT
jgi:hypothetical protein